MKRERLNEKTAIYTPASGITKLINYSEELQILEVEFTGGRVYQYLDVELFKWEEYKAEVEAGAPSGIFVNKKIKPFYKAAEI